MQPAVWIVAVLMLYAVIGIVFAPVFVGRGAAAIDPAARHSSWGFRAIIFPGAAALWPVLLWRWLR